MLDLIAIFGTSFVVALSGALMPGPLLTVTISESARRGAWAGPQLIAGHAVLEFVMVAVLLLGVGPYLQTDRAFIIIAFCGAAMMLWMAAGMFSSLPEMTLVAPAEGGREIGHPVAAGIVMSLANPYWLVWWAAIGLGYVTYSMTFGWAGILCFYTGHISGDMAWYTVISVSISRGKNYINDFVYRIMIGMCAAALAGFALWFIYSGISRMASV